MDYYQKIAIIVGSIVLLAVIVLTIILVSKKKNKTKDEEFPELVEALGGRENILEVTSKGSRVSVKVDNKKIVDKEKLKEQGVETIVISNKKVTLVVGVRKVPLIAKYLENKD